MKSTKDFSYYAVEVDGQRKGEFETYKAARSAATHWRRSYAPSCRPRVRILYTMVIADIGAPR